ncbi:MAG TPA: hypothetical protein VIF88_12855 [Methylocystis sp.]|jgi:hypothetical protein
MKFAQSQRCAVYALTGLAALLAAPAMAGDDKSTWSAMMEMVGASSDEGVGKIDYSERPKLVLPPSAGDLPPPRERSARSGEWPAELSAERRRNVNRYARVPNAPQEAPRPGMFARVLSFGSGAQQPSAPAIEEPSRVMLTEPPPGYRRPTQDLNSLHETEVAKKSSWWNPLSWGHGGDKPAATAAAGEKLRPEEQGAVSTLRKLTGMNSAETASIPGSASQQSSSSNSNSWFQMPSFARGSDDTK